MSVEYFGDRGTQTEILSGHYGCNSGQNPLLVIFLFFGHPEVFFKTNSQSYSFGTPCQYVRKAFGCDGYTNRHSLWI